MPFPTYLSKQDTSTWQRLGLFYLALTGKFSFRPGEFWKSVIIIEGDYAIPRLLTPAPIAVSVVSCERAKSVTSGLFARRRGAELKAGMANTCRMSHPLWKE
jgi:hypothetical protein